MSNPRPPRRDAAPRATVRLRDLAQDDRERAFYGPRTGDWLLLGLMVVILLGNGAYIWHQTGADSPVGRAAFFGLLLLCVLWAALVYTFKLSVCVRVGSHGLSVVRGPWRTELPWREVARLTERRQILDGQPYRWLVALARDGRTMRIRDDMVNDYLRFRAEVFERYRLWRDHGGTWGTTGGGPFTARETLAGQTFWAAVGAGTLVLPGVYFLVLIPQTDPLGWILLLLAVICAVLSARGVLRRRAYTVDAKAIEARRATGKLRLAWRDVTKVERTRHAFGGVIALGIALGRIVLKLVARTDGRVESFDWSPRVPEYLILRGAGHQVRVRLHRLERPDELLAWVEFYERVGRRRQESGPVARKSSGPTRRIAPELPPPVLEPLPADLSGPSGPADPWGAGRTGDVEPQHPMPTTTRPAAPGDHWLRGTQPPARRMPVEEPGVAKAPEEEEAPTVPAFAMPAVEDLVDAEDIGGQSLSGLDIFASRQPGPTSAPPLPPTRQTPPMPPVARPTHPPRAKEPPARATTPPLPQTPSHRQGGREWWRRDSVESQPPTEPPKMEPEPLVVEDDWLAQFPEEAEEEPTDALEGLVDSFAPWRDDANWQPPQLPRFGPPRDEKDR